jgi:hypothetical protein
MTSRHRFRDILSSWPDQVLTCWRIFSQGARTRGRGIGAGLLRHRKARLGSRTVQLRRGCDAASHGLPSPPSRLALAVGTLWQGTADVRGDPPLPPLEHPRLACLMCPALANLVCPALVGPALVGPALVGPALVTFSGSPSHPARLQRDQLAVSRHPWQPVHRLVQLFWQGRSSSHAEVSSIKHTTYANAVLSTPRH